MLSIRPLSNFARLLSKSNLSKSVLAMSQKCYFHHPDIKSVSQKDDSDQKKYIKNVRLHSLYHIANTSLVASGSAVILSNFQIPMISGGICVVAGAGAVYYASHFIDNIKKISACNDHSLKLQNISVSNGYFLKLRGLYGVLFGMSIGLYGFPISVMAVCTTLLMTSDKVKISPKIQKYNAIVSNNLLAIDIGWITSYLGFLYFDNPALLLSGILLGLFSGFGNVLNYKRLMTNLKYDKSNILHDPQMAYDSQTVYMSMIDAIVRFSATFGILSLSM